jgi:hypothetical protein
MKMSSRLKQWQWIHKEATINELIEKYPKEWDVVYLELSNVYANGNVSSLQEHIKKESMQSFISASSLRGGSISHKSWQATLSKAIRTRMLTLAVKNHLLKTATGVSHGKVKFNYINAVLAQKLLFSHGLTRKPVSNLWFHIIWPFLWQKRFLMPLVQPKGIYCFYSKKLIHELAKVIRGQLCIEVAAGDGLLSEFLIGAGVDIKATDNYSWEHAIEYSESVFKMDAHSALRKFKPEVVVCSWPPTNNSFEKNIFDSGSVNLYILIGSRHKFACGNWKDYLSQTNFSMEEKPNLSKLVFPPELDPVVYFFRRI